MNLKTFFHTIKDGLAQDSDLSQWAYATFGKQLSVWADLPSDDFPNVESDYPFVVLVPVEKSSDQRRRAINYELEAWLAFSLAGYKKTSEIGVIEPSGVDLICDFVEYVKAAVVAVCPADTTVRFIEQIDALAHPPDVEAFVGISFVHAPSIGYGDPTVI